MAKTFEFNTKGEPCPVCNKKTMKESLLVGIDGTQEGRNIQAIQVHLDCLIDHARYLPNVSMIIIQTHDHEAP